MFEGARRRKVEKQLAEEAANANEQLVSLKTSQEEIDAYQEAGHGVAQDPKRKEKLADAVRELQEYLAQIQAKREENKQ